MLAVARLEPLPWLENSLAIAEIGIRGLDLVNRKLNNLWLYANSVRATEEYTD
jgi:hypothetical protein